MVFLNEMQCAVSGEPSPLLHFYQGATTHWPQAMASYT